MIRISLDLELEQPSTNPQTPDSMLSRQTIIQVGYVIFNDETMEILEQERNYIHVPDLKLSSFIKRLTGITDEQVAQGESLVTSMDRLHRLAVKHNANRKILTWGGGDQEAILTELPTEYEWKFGRTSLNVKHLYQVYREANGLNPSSGLKKSARSLGLKFEGDAHDALTDAINTARVFKVVKDKFKGV